MSTPPIKSATIWTAVSSLLNHNRTAILTIAAAVIAATADGIQHGHVVWSTVGYAGLTALAGIARSALAPQVGTGEPGSVQGG